MRGIPSAGRNRTTSAPPPDERGADSASNLKQTIEYPEAVMKQPTKRLMTSALAIAIAVAPSLSRAQGDCFEKKENRRLTYDMFQISVPPRYSASARDYPSTSPYYPATDYVTSSARVMRDQPMTTASGDKFRTHYMLWANRCIFMKDITPDTNACRNVSRTKGNGYPTMAMDRSLAEQLRTAYSTYAKANACTLVGAMHALGEDAGEIERRARTAGITVVSNKDKDGLASMARVVVAGTGKQATTAKYLVDTCVVEAEAMGPNAAGIVLDYEVFDNRTPAEALAFLREMHDLIRRHGKTFIIATNPLPREQNGIDRSNVRDVLEIIDGLALPISSGATVGVPKISLAQRERTHSPIDSYNVQLGVLTDNGRAPLSRSARGKIIWNVSLYDTALSEARFFREVVVSQGYRGVMIFRNYVKQGGACSRPANQVTACLAFGDCEGTFGANR
jgi:hypothetical protein